MADRKVLAELQQRDGPHRRRPLRRPAADRRHPEAPSARKDFLCTGNSAFCTRSRSLIFLVIGGCWCGRGRPVRLTGPPRHLLYARTASTAWTCRSGRSGSSRSAPSPRWPRRPAVGPQLGKHSFPGSMRAAAQLISSQAGAGPLARRRHRHHRGHAVACWTSSRARRAMPGLSPRERLVGFIIFLVADAGGKHQPPAVRPRGGRRGSRLQGDNTCPAPGGGGCGLKFVIMAEYRIIVVRPRLDRRLRRPARPPFRDPPPCGLRSIVVLRRRPASSAWSLSGSRRTLPRPRYDQLMSLGSARGCCLG